MPRDSAGNYNLVSGNPVQSGEVISSSWANNTLNDVAVALSDSLDRNGRGGMLAPFRFADGTNLLPGASWTNETTTGLYRFDGGDLRLSVLTQDVMRWQTTGVQIWDNGNSQWNNVLTDGGGGGSQVPVNVGTADGQTLRWEADNSAWEATSALVVDDAGNVTATGDLTAASFIGDGSQLTNLPAGSQWDDVTGGINYAGGNVGIGTASPDTPLHVEYSGANLAVFRNSAQSQMEAVIYSDGSNTVFGQGNGSAGLGSNTLRFGTDDARIFTNGTEAMRIDSSGAVGIGTDNPQADVHISYGSNADGDSSTIYLGGTEDSNSRVGGIRKNNITNVNRPLEIFSSPVATTAPITFEIGLNNEAMRIDTSGNVQINTGNLELSNSGGWFQSDATWVRSLNDKGVFNASTAATAFATPGDFTAGYSDMRLKTHLGTIPDALDKVCSLEGFYYERNDKAVELGYTGGERRVGLSAQDVQAVLPEVVKDAPINVDNGTDYLTVDYERVVPLLVESIKDLRAEIDELKRNQK